MNEDKAGLLAMLAVLGTLILCCSLPLLIAAVGTSAIMAYTQYGLIGFLVTGLLGCGVYLLRRTRRRRRGCEECETLSPFIRDRLAKPTHNHHEGV